jgi:DNA-binding NtrC family response regulator
MAVATDKLSGLIRAALAESRTTNIAAATHLGISPRTFYRRMTDGDFTLGDLHKLAQLTDRDWTDLVPEDAA